jgi:acyl-CoA thioesterase FadM
MRRLFQHIYPVRYDECNCHGFLTPAAFIRYMQDVAALDAEDAQLAGNGYWVVKRTVISFAAPVPVHTRLELRTYGTGFTRVTAQRGYEVRLADAPHGDPIIVARTLWVYVDARGRPTRLPERTAHIWLADEALLPQLEKPFPAVPERVPETTPLVVHFSEIDLMKHLNNAAAVEMFDNASWQVYAKSGVTPDTARLDILQYDIEYGNSPRFGERLKVQSWLDPFPLPGQTCNRLQQIVWEGKVAVRAHSRWVCRVLDASP